MELKIIQGNWWLTWNMRKKFCWNGEHLKMRSKRWKGVKPIENLIHPSLPPPMESYIPPDEADTGRITRSRAKRIARRRNNFLLFTFRYDRLNNHFNFSNITPTPSSYPPGSWSQRGGDCSVSASRACCYTFKGLQTAIFWCSLVDSEIIHIFIHTFHFDCKRL